MRPPDNAHQSSTQHESNLLLRPPPCPPSLSATSAPEVSQYLRPPLLPVRPPDISGTKFIGCIPYPPQNYQLLYRILLGMFAPKTIAQQQNEAKSLLVCLRRKFKKSQIRHLYKGSRGGGGVPSRVEFAPTLQNTRFATLPLSPRRWTTDKS